MIFNPWQLVVLGMTFAMLLGLVGSYDYQDELTSQSLYCDMTAEGSWPSFNEAIDCSYQGSEN